MNEQHGFDYVGLRYMNVVRPAHGRQGHVRHVIHEGARPDRGRRGPDHLRRRDQSYDFVHVEDVARANICAAKSDATDASYNVGCGVGTSLTELVDLLLEIAGSDLEPVYEPQTQTFVTHRIGSTDAAERDLGFRAEVDLRSGLESVVAWHRAMRAERVDA